MAFASLTIDLNARIANIERDMGRAAHIAETQAKRMEGAFANVGRAMSTIGGALAGAGLLSFAKSSLDAADALNDMSIRTGVAVKDLASLQLIAEQSGTSLEGIGAGLGKLNKSASEAAGGNDKLAAALTSLGVTASTPLERFYQLADAVKGMADPTARAADLSAVLGKNFLELIPALKQGSEGMRDSAIASASFAESMALLAPEADKFNDQLAQLKINAAGAAGSILANMIPSLNEYIAVMKEVVANGSLLDKVRFFGLGNASDEIVGRVRKAAADMAKASEEARKATGADVFTTRTGKSARVEKSVRVEKLDDLSQTPFALIAKQRAEVEAAADAAAKQYSEAFSSARIRYMRALGNDFDATILELEDEKRRMLDLFGDNPDAVSLVNNLIDIEAAQAKFRELEGVYSASLNRMRAEEDGIRIDREAGLINQQTMLERIIDLHRDTADAIRPIVNDMALLGNELGPRFADSAAAANNSFRDIAASASETNAILQETASINRAIIDLNNANVDARHQAGISTDLENMREREAANRRSIELLREEQAMMEGMGNTEAVLRIEAQIIRLSAQLDLVADKFREIFENQFADAFESLLNGTKSFGEAWKDLWKNILHEINKIVARELSQQLMKVLSGKLGDNPSLEGRGIFSLMADIFAPSTGGGFSLFADGGIMGADGPMSLRKYASGGIATSPQLALFGEGSRPEAYVPLPDGRSIPVTMRGRGSGGINITMNVVAQDATSFRQSMGQIQSELAFAMAGARRFT